MKAHFKHIKPALCLLALGLSAPSLSGCTTAILGAGAFAANRAYYAEGTDFAAQNYAVADYLYQQAETFVKPKHIVTAEPLTDLEAPEVTTLIANIIPEQIGVRLSQLGYQMDLSDVSTSADTEYLRPRLEGQKPDFILTGNYIRDGNELDVKTRIIDLNNKRVVATFDYNIEVSGDIRDLSQPQAKIMRVSDNQ